MGAAEERFVRCRIHLLVHYPILGVLALRVRLLEDRSLATCAFDGEHLRYNAQFIHRLSDEQLAYIFAHVLLHIILGHLKPVHQDPEAFELAADVEVSLHLEELVELFPEDFQPVGPSSIMETAERDRWVGMSLDELYEELMKRKPSERSKLKKSGVPDDHKLWMPALMDGSYDADDWKDTIIRSSSYLYKGKLVGSMPGRLLRSIKKLTTPQKNWRELLAAYITEETTDYGFAPSDKRYVHTDLFLPDWNERDDFLREVVIAVDLSGSISPAELRSFLSEIKGILALCRDTEGYLLSFDTQIRSNIPLADFWPEHYSVKGGGGTRFASVFEWIENERITPRVVVFLTDGFGEPNWGLRQEPYYPILWVITGDGRLQPPYGTATPLRIQ
ncbi:vWA domain-containing protein [Paenibacillus naphthalenovorans]|uniref:vWA domain-containing protein n=1 Tax=Paenibacillus naphthalenovorans TaxID=162209 RepID=UPI003D2CAF2C